MTVCGAFNVLKSSFNCISWKSTGRLQQTLLRAVEISGTGLHSGDVSTVKILPEAAGKGRYFEFLRREEKLVIPAIIDFVRKESPLCTTLSNRGVEVRTVEHLLSALEGTGVDNCRIQIFRDLVTEQDSYFVEVPILDGSARPWVEAIQKVGLAVAVDQYGNSVDKKAPYLTDPVHVWKNDSFIAAFPSSRVQLTYGIDFPQVPAIGCQWFSLTQMDNSSYINQIAPSRTFCVYEEVDRMRKAGLIVGGSLDNAIVCSASKGWLNPPLRFEDEACRHKLLDLVGDFSLFGHIGNQGLPVAHVVAYKGGHALHTDFVRHLKSIHNGQ